MAKLFRNENVHKQTNKQMKEQLMRKRKATHFYEERWRERERERVLS